ncbi:MAG TPA: hypothetical protein VK663_11595 [Burkholderiales bacterium]|nr:hypothetical protein [Burkholderiales bacterium]
MTILTRICAATSKPALGAVAKVLLGTTLQLTGCATTSGDITAVHKAWLGASYDEVVARWGTPVRSTSFNDGRSVYTWFSEGTAPRGSIWPSIGVSAGSGSGLGIGIGVAAGPSRDVRVICERTLIFKDGQVVDQTWHGPVDFCGTFRRN